MTIRTRFTLWYSGLLTLIIIIFALTVMTVNRISILAVIDQTLGQTAANIAQTVAILPVGEFGPLQLQIQRLESLMDASEGMWMQVWQTYDIGGEIPARLVQESTGLNGEVPMLDADAVHHPLPHISETRFNGVLTRVATYPILMDEGRMMGVVQVGSTVNTLAQANDALVISMGIAGLISIGVSVMLGTWISSRLLKPIGNISRAAAGIVNADDLSTRLKWVGPMDELGHLTAVFNQTLARLEGLFKVQQRFVGDVSHELRTPLTSIMGNVELMQRYGVDPDSLDAVYREAERMSRMVNDLLLLARADNGELKVDLSTIELDRLLVEVYEQAHFLKKKRNLKILLGDIQPTLIHGNSDRMKQLLLNLVNNAIKFTLDEGIITLTLQHDGNCAYVDVSDTGIGISPQDQVRIFDRFFQADNSRVQRNEMDGAGLGLSIARWIVDVHKGRIEVSSQLGKGTRFRMIVPLLKQEKSLINSV